MKMAVPRQNFASGQNSDRPGNSDPDSGVGTMCPTFIPQETLAKSFFTRFRRYYSDRAMESVIASSRYENVSELAAIILSRTQLKRGEPEMALEILRSYASQHGETKNVSEEISRIVRALHRS